MSVNHVKFYRDELGDKVFEEYSQMPHAYLADNDTIIFYTVLKP